MNTTTNLIETQPPVNSKISSKSYTFDKIYLPETTQEEFYSSTVSRIVQDFIQGFNCTLFAYGMTGTGKSYTMQGAGLPVIEPCTARGMAKSRAGRYLNFDELPEAGAIPRAVNEIFQTLDSQDIDYQIRVSHMEVYCEEIYDLLKDPSLEREPLRIYEERQSLAYNARPSSNTMPHKSDGRIDLNEAIASATAMPSNAGGSGRLIVNNLEEVLVKTPLDVLSLLTTSNENRRVAETKMNSNSSRSHAIFTISLMTKEVSMNTEKNQEIDIIKISKLNLVDLAGSESISKSGASGERQQEASKINKSLLTLGRVINCLTENKAHIPYRESKLTRLLADSLGGKTKTVIVATIAPSELFLDETTNTLEYMSRAKKIKNLPEITAKISGKAVLKEYAAELKRLREILEMQRNSQGGVFVANDEYECMNAELKAGKERSQEMEANMTRYINEISSISDLLALETRKVQKLKAALGRTVATVNELHGEKSVLYEKLLQGRSKEATNISEYNRLKDLGVDTVVNRVFEAQTLLKTLSDAGVTDAVRSIGATVLECRRQLDILCDSLSADVGSRLIKFNKEVLGGLLKQFLTSDVQEDILGSQINGVLREHTLKGLDAEAMVQAVQAFVAEYCGSTLLPQVAAIQEALLSFENGASQTLERISDGVTASCSATEKFLLHTSHEIRDFYGDAVKRLSQMEESAMARIKQQNDASGARMMDAVLTAVRDTITAENAANSSAYGDIIEGHSKEVAEAHGSLAAFAADGVEKKCAEHIRSSLRKRAKNTTTQLSDLLRGDVRIHLDAAQQALGTIQKSSGLLLADTLPAALEASVAQPCRVHRAEELQHIDTIGCSLTRTIETFRAALTNANETHANNVMTTISSLASFHVDDTIKAKMLDLVEAADKLVSEDAAGELDSSSSSRHSESVTSRIEMSMSSLNKAMVLEDGCFAGSSAQGRADNVLSEPVLAVNMSRAVAALAQDLKANVAAALNTLIVAYRMTPVVPEHAGGVWTPSINSPVVKPINLLDRSSCGGDFVLGVATPSVVGSIPGAAICDVTRTPTSHVSAQEPAPQADPLAGHHDVRTPGSRKPPITGQSLYIPKSGGKRTAGIAGGLNTPLSRRGAESRGKGRLDRSRSVSKEKHLAEKAE